MELLKGISLFVGAILLCLAFAALLLWQMYWGSFTPILFHGKVVDTDGNPVADAQIYVSFDVFPYSPGVREDTTSDDQGNFSVFHLGAAVVIMTSKTGYYTLQESSGNFQAWPLGEIGMRHQMILLDSSFGKWAIASR